MSFEPIIEAVRLGKRYQLYDAPRDRLRQFILPRLRRLLRLSPKKYYREFASLADVSFSVMPGETLGIVGRNGAGKSTLLQMLCGTLTPSDGVVKVRGRVAALLELGAGFNPEFSGRDNVYMNARLLGLDERQIEERFDSIAAFADIGAFLEQPVKTYSSGMYVRLAFAVIAHVDADILVIDEALAVGDAYFSQRCMRFLRSFKERGTLLFVSHDASAVVSLCDRALWLDKGRLVGQGSAKEVMQSYLEELYGATTSRALSDAPTVAGAPGIEEGASDDAVMVEPTRTLALEPDLSIHTDGRQRFGTNLARIDEVRLLARTGESLRWVEGGEPVSITVRASTTINLDAPIIGFIVKDRLGQHLFGDNTYESQRLRPSRCTKGDILNASFEFKMPILPKGEYSIAVALADGTQTDHVVHEWLHEALLFQSHSASVVTGLVGIPMSKISLAASSMG
ncbi:ABC transporter ATP-binding protein [Pseudorhodoferax sp. Leaf267]|uniref:ABC transporter ATP-binding protein n=1 Tax=Pseudorhodoferax sp. Leaf267 TaxID=1736316 RepID=UPI0009E71E72|nr:ABC transporter ATP-binding protein [Pseudorhodoferax sp. Leaf267]